MRLPVRGLAITVFSLAVMSSFASRKVRACFQDSPSIQLRATAIAGRVTVDGKPLSGALFRLHKSLGPYAIQLRHADPHVLTEAVSAEDGSFSFGELTRGQCIISMGPPSGMSIGIELVNPKNSENDKVVINNFADGCMSATVVSADGEKIPQKSGSTFPYRK